MSNQPIDQSNAPNPGRSQQFGDNDRNRTAPTTPPQPKPMPNPI
jgi:hypothetical protein